jgi:hypothetical protein
MKKIKKLTITAIALTIFGCLNMLLPINNLYADSGNGKKICDELRGAGDVDEGVLDNAGCSGATGKNKNIPELINTIINVAIAAVGIISVGAIVLGGQRLVVSSGDGEKVKSAKQIIIYATVALVVAFLAYAIVQFVLASIGA